MLLLLFFFLFLQASNCAACVLSSVKTSLYNCFTFTLLCPHSFSIHFSFRKKKEQHNYIVFANVSVAAALSLARLFWSIAKITRAVTHIRDEDDIEHHKIILRNIQLILRDFFFLCFDVSQVWLTIFLELCCCVTGEKS